MESRKSRLDEETDRRVSNASAQFSKVASTFLKVTARFSNAIRFFFRPFVENKNSRPLPNARSATRPQQLTMPATPGTYRYPCAVHGAAMSGTIIVQ
jgi:hypothetical protein